MRLASFLVLLIATVIILSYSFHRIQTKPAVFGGPVKQPETNQVAADIVKEEESNTWPNEGCTPRQTKVDRAKKNEEIEEILAKLDRMMPNVTVTHISNTTSAKNSRATILNQKESYCVGEHLMVRLDMSDHSGKRKAYGGDFFRARISSSDLKAGASGSIKDFGNGTYLVNFTLFWEGSVRASVLLIHPSEGVSALWAARKKGYGKIAFMGKFLNGTSEVSTDCGFNLTRNGEQCEYLDERDQEAFYCLKPKQVPCEAFVHLKSYNKPVSYLTALEQSLLKRPYLSRCPFGREAAEINCCQHCPEHPDPVEKTWAPLHRLPRVHSQGPFLHCAGYRRHSWRPKYSSGHFLGPALSPLPHRVLHSKGDQHPSSHPASPPKESGHQGHHKRREHTRDGHKPGAV